MIIVGISNASTITKSNRMSSNIVLLTGYFCIGTVIDARVAALDPKPKESMFYTTDRESITGPVQKQLVHNSFIKTF